LRAGKFGSPFLISMKHVLHLLSGPPDELAAKIIESQREEGIDVEVIRLDEIQDWQAVVERVMQAGSVATW